MDLTVGFRDVLQAGHSWLVENLGQLEKVLDILYQDKVITEDDKQRVQAESTSRDQIRKLLSIISIKTTKTRTKKKFIKAISETEQDHINFYLERIEFAQKVQIILKKQFHEVDGGSDLPRINLSEVVSCVTKFPTPPFLKETDIECMIKEAISEVFETTNVTWNEQESIYEVINIARWTPEVKIKEEVSAKPTSESISCPLSNPKMTNREIIAENWKVQDVQEWLKLVEVPEQVTKDFLMQEIDGLALLELNEKDLSDTKEFPHMKVGYRKRILRKLDDLKQGHIPILETGNVEKESTELKYVNSPGTEVQTKYMVDDHMPVESKESDEKSMNKSKETVGVDKIDIKSTEVHATDDAAEISNIFPTQFDSGEKCLLKYKEGCKLRAPKTRPTDLITPVEQFVNVNLTKEFDLLVFSAALVNFVTACLNDRTNGRLYIGVDDNGTVIGTQVNKKFTDYDRVVTTLLKECFFKDQSEKVMACVRPPKFFEVIIEQEHMEKLYVVEIDVVPAADTCMDEAFFARVPMIKESSIGKMQCHKANVIKFQDGDIVAIDEEHLQKFMQRKKSLCDLRKYRENEYLKKLGSQKESTGLSAKLVNLLCLDMGRNADLYPVLVINAATEEMDRKYIEENLSFIANIQWKAVFDFDSSATILSYTENDAHRMVRVVPTTDDFDQSSPENRRNPERLCTLQEDIVSSKLPHWIFVNGYEIEEQSQKFPTLQPEEWNQTKREGFKEAVRFFKRQIPEGRAVLIFLLLSNDTSCMTEAITEFITVFKEQWVFIAEKEDIVEPIFAEIIRRKFTNDKSVLETRSVIGMPFYNVQETIKQKTGGHTSDVCSVACSTGTMIPLPDETKNELTDLEILSSNECDSAEMFSEKQLKEKEIEEEKYFYKGGEVSWWNFWFKSQVLKRTKHSEIYHMVHSTAQESFPGDFHLARLTLYHQPGAGGTTTAKHILWDFRKMYRCAIVRKITSETAKQIKKFRSYRDDNAMPVLLLIDNLEEEPVNILLASLEEQAKQTVRSGEYSLKLKPFCVSLICLRRSKMPRNNKDKYRTLLQHGLDKSELNWFNRKYDYLENKFRDQSNCDSDILVSMINPKLLISFNIMKQNFDDDFIQRTAQDLVSGIESTKERRLLRYLTLLNTFDLHFREIPSAAFDTMMIDLPWAPGLRWGKGAAAIYWELNLSNEFRILINESTSMGFGAVKALRITNKLLSKHILTVLQKLEDQKEPISSIVSDFFNCGEIFSSTSFARDTLVSIVKDLLKHRARLPTGKPETQFAPMIQYILDNESVDSANQVLEQAFTITDDAYIAQQLARLAISVQKWERAIEFAAKATGMKPESSVLWDTYGRIFLNQLAEVYKNLSEVPDTKLTIAEMLRILDMGTKGIDIFQKVQGLSEKEHSGLPTNNAGYYGELTITQCLLDCLSNVECFESIDKLRHCLIEKHYYPERLLNMIQDELSERDYLLLQRLKSFKTDTENAITRLDDERMQLRDETIDDYRVNSIKQRNHHLDDLRVTLDFYFGQQVYDIPENIDPNSDEACRIRSRQMRTLGAGSLRTIFALNTQCNGKKTLQKIRSLCLLNIETDKAIAMDYQVLIASCLAIKAIDHGFVQHVKFEEISLWSRKLYDLRDTGSNFIFLEPYLFYVLFNWPRKGLKSHVSPKELKEVLHQWREAYYNKWPRQRNIDKPYKKKDTTIFFLSYGSGLASLMSYHEIKGNDFHGQGDGFWKEPQVLRTLERFVGVLSPEGDSVSISVEYVKGNKDTIEIPTSFPIRDRAKLNKRVYFVIGFSWMGPKAFDIDLKHPTSLPEDVTYMAMDHTVQNPNKEPRNREKQLQHDAHVVIMQKLVEINNQLTYIRQIKEKQCQGIKLTKKEEALVSTEERLKSDRGHLKLERLKLVDRIKDDF